MRSVAEAGIFTLSVVVAPPQRWDEIRTLADAAGIVGLELVEGGTSRQRSVRAGLGACMNSDVVCVHDAARPLCSPRVFAAVVAAAATVGAATAALECIDTIKRVKGRTVVETLDRHELVRVQTPQAFLTPILATAHNRARDEGFEGGDDCSLVERGGGRIATVEGDPRAFKVTHADDVTLLRALVSQSHPALEADA